MSIKTRKFSQFVDGGAQKLGDKVVGLRNGQNYQFDAGASGGGASIYTITQANHGLDKTNWVYINTAGEFKKADSITAVKAEVVGVVLKKDDDDPTNKFILQTEGLVEAGTFTGLSLGRVYFLSNSPDSGQMVLNDNEENGQVSLPLFDAYTADTGFIRQFRGIINNGQQPVFSIFPDGGNGEPVVQIITQNNTFSIGQVVYNDAAGTYALAIADGSIPDGHKAVGFVAAVPPPTATQFTLQQSGYMSGFIAPVANLNPAKQYWLSTTTAGAIQDAEPTTIGHWKKPMLQAVTTTAGWILPQLPLQITSATTNPIVKQVTQAAHGFTYIGQVVKPKTTALGEYEAANASNLNGAFGVGMIASIPDINTFTVQESGYISGLDAAPFPAIAGGIANPASPFTVGNNKIGVPFYLSAANAGQITTVEPLEPFYSKPIFSADQNGGGWILPMKPSLVHAGGGGGELVQLLDFYDDTPLDVTYSTAAYTAIPFLSKTITPSSVGSRIKITMMVNMIAQYFTFLSITRDGVAIPAPGTNFFTIGGQVTGPASIPNSYHYRNVFVLYIDRPNTILPVTYGLSILGQVQPASPMHALFNQAGPTGYPSGYTTWTLEEYA